MGENEMKSKSRKKRGKKSKIVSFEAETITKDVAEVIVKAGDKKRKLEEDSVQKEHTPKNKKPTVTKEAQNTSEAPSKKQKKRNASKPPDKAEIDTQDELDPKKPQINTEESIRARKKRKYAALVEAKKLKSELDMQQKCLNYLSMWKHSKNEWKFEKLKQCWLLNNVYDDAKVPEEFFQTLVEYFNNSKGKIRDEIIKAALKVIKDEEGNTKDASDKEDVEDEEEDEEIKEVESNVKYERARSIVQNLQE